MQPINLFAWTQARYLSPWQDVIIFQSENNAHSVFYGRRLTYLSTTDSRIAKFAFKRSMRTESWNGKVVYPIYLPSNFNGSLRNADRTSHYNFLSLMPRATERERFANESYEVVEYGNEQCSIFLSIAEEDFTFMTARDFESYIEVNWDNLPYIWEWDSLFTQSLWFTSICNSGDKFWTTSGESNVIDTFTWRWNAQWWYVKNLRTSYWSYNNNMESYWVIDIRVNRTSDQSQAWDIVVTEMNPEFDEAFIEIWQLIKFTLNSLEPNRLIIMPQNKFRFQTVLKPAYFHLDYVYGTDWEHRMRILAPQEQSENPSARFAFTATYWTSISSSLSQNDIYRAISSLNEAGYTWPLENNIPAPVPMKFKTGDIVTADIEWKSHIPFRFKNREWKISGYRGYSNAAKQHQYVLTPHFKKNINKGSDVTAYENELKPVEKILKRKYELARKIGKYKQWQVFTKEELVTTFAKFQDAQDPFILNKIYICAESPSEKSEH